MEKQRKSQSQRSVDRIDSPGTIPGMHFTARNDYAFKKLFGRPENSIILQEFLSVVLKLEKTEFKDIIIENPAVGNYYADDKQGILDIKLTLQNGQKISVEMQNLWEPYYEKRTYFYWANRYLEKFKPGTPYDYLAKCICIHILDQKFPLADELHSIYRVLNVKTFQPFSDDLEFHFLDLTKLTQEKNRSDLALWLTFIQTDNPAVREELGRRNAVMQYANEVMNQFYASKEERLNYEAALRYESDRATLLAAGEEKVKESLLQVARNMKAKNFDATMIQEITGLTREQIATL